MKSLAPERLASAGSRCRRASQGDMIHSTLELMMGSCRVVDGHTVPATSSTPDLGSVGMGAPVRGKQMFLKAGDVVASIDGIGTLTVPVVAGPKPPDGTRAYLPPVAATASSGAKRGATGWSATSPTRRSW